MLQSSASSAPTYALVLGQRDPGKSVSRSESTPEEPTNVSRRAEPVLVFKKDRRNPVGSLGQSKQQDSGLTSPQHSTVAKPLIEEACANHDRTEPSKPGLQSFTAQDTSQSTTSASQVLSDAARSGSTADNCPSEPQPDDRSVQDERSDLSDVEELSDEEFTAEDEELIGSGDASSQSHTLAMTKKTVTYDEIYEAARDPHAKYKHCEYFQ